MCLQGDESHELVDAIGGHWITRQVSTFPKGLSMSNPCVLLLGDPRSLDSREHHNALYEEGGRRSVY